MMPLDTIKTRAHLDARYQNPLRGLKVMIAEEGLFSIYKGLPALVVGLTPKVAIRFCSFQVYQGMLLDAGLGERSMLKDGLAGMMAGATESLLVVTPMEMVKVRMQDDSRGGTTARRYGKGFFHAVRTIVAAEGPQVVQSLV